MTTQLRVTRRNFLGLVGATGMAGAALGLFGCGQSGASSASGGQAGTGASDASASGSSAASAATASASGAASTGSVELNPAAWGYDSDKDVYYQIGVQYCTSPQAPTYESMGIYVPGAYFDAQDNGDGTFTCQVSSSGKVGNYTAASAPVVMPINTAGYSAQAAPTEYSADRISSYLEQGFVYVYAGCRGRKLEDDACGAAPWGVTDLKAAVRTLRYNDSLIPGDKGRIFSFGHSGGGAQSAVLGVSGDAAGYDDYLAAIGAPSTDASGAALSDAIYGAMCWCPITCLMSADAAYEWNMGQFASDGTRAEGSFTRQLSQDLAGAYLDYVNALGLVDGAGKALSLKEGGEGVACSGTYYDYVVAQIEESLNNFLADTEFPYTPSNSFSADMGAGGGGRGKGGGRPDGQGGRPSGEAPSGGASSGGGEHGRGEGMPSGEAPSGGAPSGSAPSGSAAAMPSGEAPSGGAPSGEAPSGGAPSGSAESASASGASASSSASSKEATTYQTVSDYIAALNGDEAWISYDEKTNTATISGLAGFVKACKNPSKSVGAFDAFDRSQAENGVFGNDANEGLHFDTIMAALLSQNEGAYAKLSDWDSAYPKDYADDLEYEDAQGKSSEFRQQLYDPLYYLSEAYEGAGTSSPAPHWRIRTGITQGDTASTTEMNLALALGASSQVQDVDFATVWGQGHTTAERTGSSTDNFIEWVNSCCK